MHLLIERAIAAVHDLTDAIVGNQVAAQRETRELCFVIRDSFIGQREAAEKLAAAVKDRDATITKLSAEIVQCGGRIHFP